RPAIVQEALQSCDSEASNTIVIGDTPWDISSGKAVGTRTVGVATGIFEKEELTESGADLIVDTLEATEELFEFLLARNN
ncbi:MAG: HAD hydrolase-like protein, partial [Dehalococcoidia bacterium]|nr:HAD hydrolase-like protein [Dehalococcoidia bacterium]